MGIIIRGSRRTLVDNSAKMSPRSNLTAPLSPCVEVASANDYVIIKDRKGASHFLLMPISRISGIESPLLLSPGTPNYFKFALASLSTLHTRFGAPFDTRAISLSVNSVGGRSQDQLHIHISCLKPQVEAGLGALTRQALNDWQELPSLIGRHRYFVRLVDFELLEQEGPFRLLALWLPEAREEMGNYSIAIVRLLDGRYLLLTTKRELTRLNLASAEEIQDQDCRSFR